MRKKSFNKNKVFISKHLIAISIVFFTLLVGSMISCNMGLGKEIDLIPPVLEVTSHKNLDYVSSPFVLRGRATDNEKVDKVIVVDSASQKQIAETKPNGEKWEVSIYLSEGEHSIEVIAYDRNKNSGFDS